MVGLLECSGNDRMMLFERLTTMNEYKYCKITGIGDDKLSRVSYLLLSGMIPAKTV
jgi:hypothetical protein